MMKRMILFAGLWVLGMSILWSQTIHFQEGFGSTAPGAIPAGWTLKDGGQAIDQVPPIQYDSAWTVTNSYLGSDLGQGNFLFIRYNSSLTQGDTIETPVISVTSPTGYVYLGYLTYYNSLGSGDSGIVEVFDGTTWQRLTKYGNGVDVGGWGTNAAWERFDITPYVNPNLKVRFIYHDLNDWYWAIDSVTVFSACLGPSTIDIAWLNSTSAILTYSASYDSIKVEYGMSGFAQGTGTIVTLSGTSPDTITGLNWTNGYDFYVWFYCGLNVSVDTAFLTLCPVQSTPYTEPFDDPNLLTTCWTTNDTTTALVGFDAACSLDSGYLQLWGQSGSYAESPYISVTPGNIYEIAYYYRAGNTSCGETPDGGDQVRVEWFDTAWHELALYDGGSAPDVWTPESFTICPATSVIKLRFYIVNGSGASFDSWQFDSLQIIQGPATPDVKVLSVSNVGLACGSTGTDTFIVTYTNYGTATNTVWIEVTTPGGTQTVTVDYTAVGGFGGCSNPNDVDTVKVPGVITSTGVVPVSVIAKGVSDADLNDTVNLSFVYGDRWVYIDINTQSFGSEVFWKLFYMPDSIEVASVPSNTYASNSSYTDSVCVIDGATYRFEAWDSWGDGWNGGTYQVYAVSVCGDTIIYANNGGNSPNNGSSGSNDLESVEYFTIYNPNVSDNVALIKILQPSQTVFCGTPLQDSLIIVVKNTGANPVDSILLGYSYGAITFNDTFVYTTPLASCAYDTLFVDTLNISGFIGNMDVWARGNTDLISADDTSTLTINVGERWAYIDINTQSFGSEVFWKLFYMPDSILIKEVPSNTYASNSSYTDSVCVIDGATYRFEAWDSWGDGWNGGTYEWYLKICNDRLVLANNNGQTPDNGTGGSNDLETVEYFDAVVDTNIRVVAVLPTSLIATCNSSYSIDVVTQNFNEFAYNYDVAMSGAFTGGPVTINAQACQYDTTTFTLSPINAPIDDSAFVYVVASADAYPSDDTITVYVKGLTQALFDQLLTIDSTIFDICQGDTVQFGVSNVACGYENFDDTLFIYFINSLVGIANITDTLTTCFGTSPSASSPSVVAFDGSNPRGIVIGPINALTLEKITFYLSYSIDNFSANCNAPETGEEVYVQYSTDNGNTWNTIGLVPISTTGSFNYYEFDVPAAARRDSAMFRIVQLNSSGSGLDFFAIDELKLVCGSLTYTWTPSGVVGDTLNIYTWASPTDTTIIYLNMSMNGCSDQDTVTVYVSPVPNPVLPSDTGICPGYSVTLDATVNMPGASYSWSNGATTPTLTVSNSGTYIVVVTVGPGCSGTDTTNVTVYPKPQASIIGPDIVDANIPNTYNASPTGTNYTYQWNTGETTQAITYVATTPGKDTLQVIVTNQYGCSDTAIKVIEVITGVEVALTYGYQLRYYQPEAIAQIITGKDMIEWVEVRDVAGRIIDRRMVNGRDVTLSLKALPKGTYLVVVKGQEAGTIVYKLLR